MPASGRLFRFVSSASQVEVSTFECVAESVRGELGWLVPGLNFGARLPWTWSHAKVDVVGNEAQVMKKLADDRYSWLSIES